MGKWWFWLTPFLISCNLPVVKSMLNSRPLTLSLPFGQFGKGLVSADFQLLAPEFSGLIIENLSCDLVRFVTHGELEDVPAELRDGLQQVWVDQRARLEDGGRLFLPIWSGDELTVVAIMDDCSSAVTQSSGLGYLSHSISRELLLLKEGMLDPLTGMLGSNGLLRRYRSLQTGQVKAGQDVALVLVDFCPGNRRSGQVFEAVNRAGAYLEALVGQLGPVCHLGSGLFALLWWGSNEKATIKRIDLVRRWLKRENFSRIRVGIAVVDGSEDSLLPVDHLARTWQALDIASDRGPFGLCSYSSIANRDAHPLQPPSGEVMTALSRLWYRSPLFGLVLLHHDEGDPDGRFPAAIIKAIGDVPCIILNGAEVFVYLEGAGEEAVEEWCLVTGKKLADLSLDCSMGGAGYPSHHFRKKDMAANCRKALLHAVYYGSGSFALFDAISLNISGDIYYNEGDLVQAAREYRLALRLEPENSNLKNSLGVTYANMNRYRQAVPLFQAVLGRDDKNLMALSNLAFAWLALGDSGLALDYLEGACANDEAGFDLLFQLGKLYCRHGRYVEAVTVLGQVEAMAGADISHGTVYRYFGEACLGLEEVDAAMGYLERAVRYNSRDAAAVSMLGEVYARAGQGLEVAHAFCSQAVDLDPALAKGWLRLAMVQVDMDDWRGAVDSLRQGLSIDRNDVAIVLQLALCYRHQGRRSLALKMLKRVLRLQPDHSKAGQVLTEMIKEDSEEDKPGRG